MNEDSGDAAGDRAVLHDDGRIFEQLESIGFSVVFDIAGIVISNIPAAEADIQKFIASLTGLSVPQVRALSLADYGEIILDVATNEDFKDFFKRVMKLFNR